MILERIRKAIEAVAPEGVVFSLERPERPEFGEYSTNVALVAAEREKKSPRDVADEYARKMSAANIDGVEKIDVAGAGFINFHLSPSVFSETIRRVLDEKGTYGRNQTRKGEKIIVEYTDPNPFKEFHIGHLMSNAIGEAIARLFDASGAEVKRANYQGDIGLHVAKAIYGMRHRKFSAILQQYFGSSESRAHAMGAAYAFGSKEYERDPAIAAEINAINKEIYENKNPFAPIHGIYRMGRQWSMDYFDAMYERLGTAFDFYFFESESAPAGKKIVEEGLGKNIFETGEGGAVIFRGENHGLHTRVFLNSGGLPTYEAKELGLAQIKREKYPYDLSITVTGNEVTDYFRVVRKAMELLWGGSFVSAIRHIPHGMLRLPEGKMSSRTGKVVTADSLFEYIRGELTRKITRKIEPSVVNAVAVAAVKYSVLRQAAGRDVIFDFDKSLSFEGDSGPYLQYTHARARSVLEKARALGVKPSVERAEPPAALEKQLFAFPDVVSRAQTELAPHRVATYLIELARAFNSYYATERIADAGDSAPYRAALAEAVAITLKNGLNVLGITAPERM